MFKRVTAVVVADGLQVEFTRKCIKNINLRIDRAGKIRLSAPYDCPVSVINGFIAARRDWIISHVNKALAARPTATTEVGAAMRQDFYRIHMQKLLPPLIQKWEPIIGVTVAQWRIKTMRTRWGSCNTVHHRISLSLALMQKPLHCLEYVLVHEMVHLLEASHNRRFYRLMDQFMPQWRQYKRDLSDQPAINNHSF